MSFTQHNHPKILVQVPSRFKSRIALWISWSRVNFDFLESLLFGIILSQTLFTNFAQAQIDPSSALLLNGSGRSSSRDNGLDSGRYTVRPRSDAPRSRSSGDESVSRSRPRTAETSNSSPASNANLSNSAAAASANSTPASTSDGSMAPAVHVESSNTQQVQATNPQEPKESGQSATAPVAVKPAPIVMEAPVTSYPPVSSAATLAVPYGISPAVPEKSGERQTTDASSDDDAIRQAAVRDEGPRAPQNNLLDISFSAGYLYNDSSSTYSFRKYSTAAPAVNAEARIWLSPEFGLGGSYLTTLSGSLSDGSNPSRVVPITQQTTTLGIRYRDFFTRDLTYPYLIWGADYYQYHLGVPQDAQSRADISTTGVRLSVLGVFPTRRSYAWNLGFALLPKMYHHEGSNTAGFKSGGHADSNAVEFLVGGQWQLSPSSSMFWRVNYQIEKDLFTGDASIADPSSNTTPHGVSVTNSSVLLQMGYGWGN